ncbi:TonB-dependent receptor [Aureivirga sp. CE67]|uniref:TonB-dependent receptor n=1 Tax=Aureivirga sp. CE67 TaxID=1788983 RepID=UPI0018CB13E8|nr:TonB-dependent receptor [Aureivirga sp. CE67]
MRTKLFFILILFTQFIFSQNTISGKVIDEKRQPIFGVNVYIQGTFDGATTDENGNFSFETEITGEQTIIASFVSYDTYEKSAEISSLKNITIQLTPALNTLDVVELDAGKLKSGVAENAVMSPIDVVTTAGSAGDFVAALQTLPGTQTNGEDGRLFIRGGDAGETQIFIDGLRVFQPYIASANNVPTRSRYSPFLFQGISLSTGGFDVEFGDALSAILDLETIDEPRQNETNISIMSLGGGIGKVKKWDKSSLTINASYINLGPYVQLINDRFDWKKPYETLGGEAVYRQKVGDGLWKVYGAFSMSDFDVIQPSINLPEGFRTGLKDRDYYMNTSYKGMITNSLKLTSGVSFSYNHKNIQFDDTNLKLDNIGLHAKVKLRHNVSNMLKFQYGAETFYTNYDEHVFPINSNEIKSNVKDNYSAVFTDATFFFSQKLATKVGVRGQYSEVLDAFRVAPRVNLAYKWSKYAQVSASYGLFYQKPENDILKYTTDLKFREATHYTVNFDWSKNNRIFRANAFYKTYEDLIKYDREFNDFTFENINNSGDGYVKGFDFFWKDSKSIKNLQYWVSYTFTDSQRDYKFYPELAQPSFVSKHNFSFVSKYWIGKLKSQVGLTYSFASGRPYTNPNTNEFLGGRTKAYNNISFNWSFLISQQKILYFSATNLFGFKNVFGYEYSDNPNINGQFDRMAITPSADRGFFVGFFWTISEDKKSNQLDNL